MLSHYIFFLVFIRILSIIKYMTPSTNFGTLPKAYEWLFFSCQNQTIDVQRLVNIAMRQGNISSLKRIGWALEQAGAPLQVVQKIKNLLPEQSSRVTLSPKNRKGDFNKFWGVVENV